MNRKQKAVVWIGMVAVVLIVAYPPWNYTNSPQGAAVAVKDAGYHFIAAPPPPEREYSSRGVEVDWRRVLLQLGAVAVVMGGLVVTLADRKAAA